MSLLCRISRKLKRQSFRSDSRRAERGCLCFCLCSFILSSYIPVFIPSARAWLPPFSSSPLSMLVFVSSKGSDKNGESGSEESIMKLFKFVSNIEISFMPGKLIIEVYRGTGGELARFKRDDLFVFRSTIVSYSQTHRHFSFSLLLPVHLSLSFFSNDSING